MMHFFLFINSEPMESEITAEAANSSPEPPETPVT